MVITIISSFFGAAIVYSLSKKNFGSTADWVSSVISILALIFAYWQIYEQKKEYEEDKRQLQLSKRPLFEIYTNNILSNSNETFFFPAEQLGSKNAKTYFVFDKHKHQFLLTNQNFFYCIRNVANCEAINPTLVITYKSSKLNDIDIIHADTTIKSGDEARLLTNEIINENYMPILRAKKNIELYFMSTDGKYYRQKFKGRTETIFRYDDNTVPEEITFVSDGIEEIEKNELPDYTTATEMKVIDKTYDYPEIIPVRKFNIF